MRRGAARWASSLVAALGLGWLGCAQPPGAACESCFDVVLVSVTDRDGRTGAYEGAVITPESTTGFSCPPRSPSPDPTQEAWCLSDGRAGVPIGPRDGYATRPEAVMLNIWVRSSTDTQREMIREGTFPLRFASDSRCPPCLEALAEVDWAGSFPVEH